MRALVTGGAGFIGSHLAEALCRRGVGVVVLDNLSSGRPENLAWRRPEDRLDWVEGDVRDAALMAGLVRGCDWVFHLAAIASVPFSVEQPAESNAHNLDATLGLLMGCRDAGVKRFVFSSSCALYGDSGDAVKTESTPPCPLSPYALQKYAAEQYGRLFHHLYGLPTVGLRYFNVFGPRQSWDSPYSGVIARFCTAFLKPEAPVIFGDGRQSRDFVYVANVVEANLRAAETDAEAVAGKVFNVGMGQDRSLLELVETLNRLTGQSIEPVFAPPRSGEVRRSCADVTAARRCLGYEAKVSWETGLERTLDFYRGGGMR